MSCDQVTISSDPWAENSITFRVGGRCHHLFIQYPLIATELKLQVCHMPLKALHLCFECVHGVTGIAPVKSQLAQILRWLQFLAT